MTTGELTFIGTATTLLRHGPFTVLTDPSFLHRGQFAYLGKGLVSRRRTEPSMQPADLPPLDAVVLSHLHGDHWDRVARRGLDRGTPVVTTPHAARRLRGRQGFGRAQGLGTWESWELVKDGRRLRVTAAPGRHAGGTLQRLLPPVMGSVLEFGDADGRVDTRVYLTGDTLLYDGLGEVATRYPRLDTCVLHLGGTTLPGGLLVTMDGEQGVGLLELVRPAQAVPIHYDDYGVFKSPLEDFRRAVQRRGWRGDVSYVERGETVAFGQVPRGA
jgi:L-ascorbate metabolism protein UlaG (beta-lactamase superfamily)